MEARWPRLSHDRDILEYPLCGQAISCPPGTEMKGKTSAADFLLLIKSLVRKVSAPCSAVQAAQSHIASGGSQRRRKDGTPAGPAERAPLPAPADPPDGS